MPCAWILLMITDPAHPKAPATLSAWDISVISAGTATGQSGWHASEFRISVYHIGWDSCSQLLSVTCKRSHWHFVNAMPAAISVYQYSYDCLCTGTPKSCCRARQYLKQLYLVWTASQHNTVAGDFISLTVIWQPLHATLLSEQGP